jgi:hypothetical protein
LQPIWDEYNNVYLKNWHALYLLKRKIHKQILSNKKITKTDDQLVKEYNTNIAFSLSKIEDVIDKIISNTSVIHSGQNSFFEKKGQIIQKAYFLIPLDIGIQREQYTPYNCAFNGNNLMNELSVICEMLPP